MANQVTNKFLRQSIQQKSLKKIMEQFSQISTIKRQNVLNSRTYNKEYSELKYSQASVIDEQNKSFDIQKLLTSIGKRKEHSFELSSVNYMPEKNTSNFQQKRFNGFGNQSIKNQLSTAIVNTTNPSLAIQSQPNQMLIGFSSYFKNEQLDYNKIIFPVTEYEQLGARKILKFILNVEKQKYKIKVGFEKIKRHAQEKKQLYLQSFQVRQSGFINLVIKKSQDSYWHEKIHEKIGMPYYNKLMGLCASELVVNKKFQLIEKNIEKFKVLKEQSNQQVLQPQEEVTKAKYKFNFKIVPCLPFQFEKNKKLKYKQYGEEEKVVQEQIGNQKVM